MVVVVVLIWLEIGPGTIAEFGYKSKLVEIDAPCAFRRFLDPWQTSDAQRCPKVMKSKGE